MKTFLFRLQKDTVFPTFRRLHWEMTDVSLQDVLMKGVHPWNGQDKHPSLTNEFLERLNAPEKCIKALDTFDYCNEMHFAFDFERSGESRFEQMLRKVRDKIYFVDNLSYLELLEMAKKRLRDDWDHALVVLLLRQVCMGFSGIRQFLQAKDRTLKLCGYQDLDNYDLGRILSLEDFTGHDNLLIDSAVKSLNFRNTSFLNEVTDEYGRLRLTPEIRELSLVEKQLGTSSRLIWHTIRSGNRVVCCPDIGDDIQKRKRAREFARVWRSDNRKYCFQTSMEKVCQMVEQQVVEPVFPGLDYRKEGDHSPTASAIVTESRIPVYHIERFPAGKMSGDYLREILKHYGIPMTGKKVALLDKLAKLALALYQEHRSALDAFFGAHQFIRIGQSPLCSEDFPLLRNIKYIRGLVLTIYLLRHLRGNTIVDAGHENNTFDDGDAAAALVKGHVEVYGGFVRAM